MADIDLPGEGAEQEQGFGCPSCGREASSEDVFCRFCGHALTSAPAPTSEMGAPPAPVRHDADLTQPPSEPATIAQLGHGTESAGTSVGDEIDSDLGNGDDEDEDGEDDRESLRRHVFVAASLIFIVLGGAITFANVGRGPALPFAASPSPTPFQTESAPSSYQELLMGRSKNLRTAAVCTSYKSLIIRWQAVAAQRMSRLAGAPTNPYDAYEFAKGKRDWLDDNTATTFGASGRAIGERRLLRLAGMDTRYITDGMVTMVGRDLRASCNVDDKYAETRSALAALDRRTAQVLAAAARRPWYPRGYNAYLADEDIAWRWSNTRECQSSSYGYCWGMLIKVRSACPSYLYAEVEIKTGSRVIDFSNDTLSGLDPGETGELSFEHYGGSGTLYASLSEISCL